MSFVSTYGGNLATGKHTGMKGIEAAINAGMTINQIRDQLRREGVQTGERATEFLAARPQNSFISQYGGNEYTMRNAGMQSITAALAAGLSAEEIERSGAAEGVQFMERARNFLDADKRRREQVQQQQSNFQQQIQQQQQQFQQQLAAQQQQAQEAQRQLMIQMNRPERAPAEVRMAGGNQQQQQLRKRGTTGYFGRQGLRIGSLNVPTPGMQMSAGAAMQPASGTFS